MTVSGKTLNERLHKSFGDWRRVTVTTNIAADNKVVSTTLNQYDNARDGVYVDHWVYIEDKLNTGIERKIQYYNTANATARVYGANFTVDASNASNVWFSRYPYSDYEQAIKDASMELYPTLHKKVTDKSLATNSHLYEYPLPSSFDNGDVYSVAVNTGIGATSTIRQQLYRYDFGWSITNEGNTLRMSKLFDSGLEVKIEGIAPIEQATATTNVNIAEPQVGLLTAYAKYLMVDRMGYPISSMDEYPYEKDAAKAYGEFKRLLPKTRMSIPRPLKMAQI